jgi:hypothetical protein
MSKGSSFAKTVLRSLHVALVPRSKDGRLNHAVARLTTQMAQEAANLTPHITVLPLLAASPGARTTIEEFTNGWIPLTTVIGFALRRAFIGGD